MLDGGIVDSIPLLHAINEGFEYNVVVLTRNRGYRKEVGDIKIPPFLYYKYPNLRQALSKRCTIYNEQLELIEQMEEQGRVLVIRPLEPVKVDRIEKDTKKLKQFYDEGYECTLQMMDNIKSLLKEEYSVFV